MLKQENSSALLNFESSAVMTPNPNSMIKQERPTFRGIQVLRGLAAAMVVALHATQSWSQRVGGQAPAFVWGNGAAGVDIFFVISGFVMAVSTIGKEHKVHPARNFLERRLIRIAPLYWVATIAVIAKAAIVSHYPNLANAAEHPELSVSYIASSLLFIPYRNSLDKIEPILNVGWTLSFEMFFYLLFAAALALRARVAVWLTPLMIGLVLAGSLAHHLAEPMLPAIWTLTNPILLEFLAGLLLGQLVLSGHRLNPIICSVTGAVGMAVLFLIPWTIEPRIRAIGWGIPATLIVIAMVSLERDYGHLWPRWTLKLGDASYSLYLFHLLFLGLVAKVLAQTSLEIPGLVRVRDEIAIVLIALCVCLPAALLIFRFVEKPMTNSLRRWMGADLSLQKQR